MNDQEKKVATWVLFGLSAAGMKSPYRTAEEVWSAMATADKLKMEELYLAHSKWFKENT